jgi:serine/threonine-protein kinase
MGLFALPLRTKLTDALTLESCVVEGPLACIYAASQGGSRVSVKVLHPPFAERQEFNVLFLEAARAAARQPVPGGPRVLGSGSSIAGVPYIVCEPLDAVLLASRIRAAGGRMAPRDATELVCRVLETLHACHARGLFQGDLRPDTVAIPSGAGIQLWDTEYFKLHVAVLQRGADLFSMDPRFTAPELCARRSLVPNVRTDVFAAAALLHHMVTGGFLFDAVLPDARLRAAAQRTPTERWPLTGTPPPLFPILERALAYDPGARFTSAQELRDALASVVALLPSRTPQAKTAQVMTMKSEFAPKELLPDLSTEGPDDERTIAADYSGAKLEGLLASQKAPAPAAGRAPAPAPAARPAPPPAPALAFGSIGDVELDDDDDERTIAHAPGSLQLPPMYGMPSPLGNPGPAASRPAAPTPGAGRPAPAPAAGRVFAQTAAMGSFGSLDLDALDPVPPPAAPQRRPPPSPFDAAPPPPAPQAARAQAPSPFDAPAFAPPPPAPFDPFGSDLAAEAPADEGRKSGFLDSNQLFDGLPGDVPRSEPPPGGLANPLVNPLAATFPAGAMQGTGAYPQMSPGMPTMNVNVGAPGLAKGPPATSSKVLVIVVAVLVVLAVAVAGAAIFVLRK